jgi:hypothetical protein
MKGAHAINDGCWFTACANRSGKYLVPTQLTNPACPDKLCQVLFDIIEDGNVSIDHVQNDIVCTFDKNPSKPSKPIQPQPQPTPNGPPTSESEKLIDFVRRYKYDLLAIAILIIVLIIVAIC